MLPANDPDKAFLDAKWSRLSAEDRARVMAIVRATAK
jgi:hypothetical protein